MSWSAAQYTRFEDERTRPVRDLIGALPAIDARQVIDIGCGPGNSTEVLAARFPGAAVRGLDTSADMLAAARQRLPGTRFDLADLAPWAYERPTPEREHFDVILGNAVLQWLPEHPRLLPALAAKLAAGGALALQMPDNLDEPAHRLMRETAIAGPWSTRLAAAGAATARPPLASAAEYYAVLRGAGCRVDIWRTTYYHALAGAGAVVEWFKGSGLRPFIDALDAGQRPDFLASYQAAVAHAYPAQPDGVVLLPFPRLFIVALK